MVGYSYLDDWQLTNLDRLVGISSVSGEEPAILQYISGRLREAADCRVSHQQVDDTRFNIIAERGAEQPSFTLMLYAHVDTVRRKDGWENDYKLIRDQSQGKLRGVGVYDMKSGVMMILDLLERANIPPGVRVIGAFCGDEETNSAGAKKLMEWDGLRSVDLILSPEIATPPGREDRDHPKDIVVARRGILKTSTTITTPGGHGSLQGVPNAIEASREMRGYMKFSFPNKQDPLFGNCGEQLDETYEHGGESDFLDLPTSAEFRLRQMLLPGNSLQKALEWQFACARSLADAKAWAAQKITHILNQRSDRTSYEPFQTDTSHPVIQNAVFPSAQEIFGSYAQVGGLSPTDACVLAKAGKPVLEIGPSGGDAHRGTEWVSERSVALTLAFYRHLIEQRIPAYILGRNGPR